MKRTEYHREHYAKNSTKLSARKQQSRDDFDLATSYWRQKLVFKRDMPNLIAKVSDSIVERARVDYEKVLDQYEKEDVLS